MLIPLIYLISGWRWALFTSDVPLLGKTDERTGAREWWKWTSIKKRAEETEEENSRGPLGPVAGRLEQGAAAPLSAVMRPVVDGPFILILAPPLPPVSGAQKAGAKVIESDRSLIEAFTHPGCLSTGPGASWQRLKAQLPLARKWEVAYKPPEADHRCLQVDFWQVKYKSVRLLVTLFFPPITKR